VKNLVNQAAVFCVKNALKLTSDHLRLEKIFRGYNHPTPEGRGEKKREDREGKGRRGRGKGEGRRGGATVPPKMFVYPRPCNRH
jgi:hypothetical protein